MKGIWFNDVHSYTDLHLILSSVDVPPATVKTSYVDNPGGDGSWDLTEAKGKVNYKNRECKFTFSVLPTDDFEQKKTEVSNLLNGRRFKIVLDKDPEYFWEGRCTINKYESKKMVRKIVVSASVAPYKYKTEETSVKVALSATPQDVILTNGRKAVSPTIICTGNAKIVADGAEYSVGEGTHKILNIQLTEGGTEVTVSGSGTLTFVYQEGDL